MHVAPDESSSFAIASRVIFIVSVIIHILLWVFPIFFIGVGEGTAILRYNAYFGIDVIGSERQVLLLPGVAFFFLLVAAGLSVSVSRRENHFAGLLFSVGALLVQVASAIAVLALILANH